MSALTLILLGQNVLLMATAIALFRKVRWLELTVTRISGACVTGVDDLSDWPRKYGRSENGYLVVDDASIRQCAGEAGDA